MKINSILIGLIMLLTLVRKYENENLDREHKETWYIYHIWLMIETSFNKLKNIETVIGESTGFLTKKKNRIRSIGAFDQMNAMKHGHRCGLFFFVPTRSMMKSLTNLTLLKLSQRMKMFMLLKQWLRDISNCLGS